MLNLLCSILIQILMFIINIALIGVIIYLIQLAIYKITKYNKAVIYGTGIIGTPIHESSHALLCLAFRHKITKVCLFQKSNNDGTMGYVSHKYNKKNFYHRLGNFFIGIAPILIGCLIIFLLTLILLPKQFGEINGLINDFSKEFANFSFKVYLDFFVLVFDIFKTIFLGISVGFRWWIYIILTSCIALHVSISTADLRAVFDGLPFFLIIIVGTNLLIFLIGLIFKGFYSGFTYGMNYAGCYYAGILCVALGLSLLLLFIIVLIYFIIKLFKRIFKRNA